MTRPALTRPTLTRPSLSAAGESAARNLRLAQATTRNAEAVEAMGMARGVVGRWLKDNDGTLRMQERAADRGGVILAFTKFWRLTLQMLIMAVGAWLVGLGWAAAHALVIDHMLSIRPLGHTGAAFVILQTVALIRHGDALTWSSPTAVGYVVMLAVIGVVSGWILASRPSSQQSAAPTRRSVGEVRGGGAAGSGGPR